MVAKRRVRVEHIVEDEVVLTAARPDGTGGGAVTLSFFPAPGGARVFALVQDLPTSTEPEPSPRPHRPGAGEAASLPGDATTAPSSGAEHVVFLKRPSFPRPQNPLDLADPGEVFPGNPSTEPRPKQLTFEVARRGDAKRTIDVEPGTFTVPGNFGPMEPFEDEGDGPLVSHPSTGDVATDRDTPARPAAPITPIEAWECRITNTADHDVKVFARVFFIVRRVVTITRIPIDRLTSVFQGALRALTPTINAARGDIVVAVPQEFADEFGIDPIRKDLGSVEATSATVAFVPFDFSVIRLKVMFRDAFAALEKALSGFGFKVPADFNDKLVTAALRNSLEDLVDRAVALVPAHGAAGLSASALIPGLFEQLDIPRKSWPSPNSDLSDLEGDLAIRASITVDEVTFEGEAAIGAFQILADNLKATLDVHIGTERIFTEHPQSGLPESDPAGLRHHNEFTTLTRVTWQSRFLFSVADVDADADFGSGPLAAVAEAFVNFIVDRFEWLLEDEFEDKVRTAVREILSTHADAFAGRAQSTLLAIADRTHLLHDVSRDGDDVIIEHFDLVDDRVVDLRPFQAPKALKPPIDGEMPADAENLLGQIDHIVVVMMENRSFDHMLGWLSHPSQFSGIRRRDIDGLTGDERIPLGANVTGAPATPGFSPQAEWRPDPDHSFNAAALQIGDGAMDGFIPAFRRRLSESPEIVKHGLLDDERRIVSGQPAIRVPVFAYLAEQFCVLDRWFASFPGPTFVNRMCEMTGLTTERTNSALAPDLGYLDARTLFELLDRGNVPWQVYEGDISFLRTFDRFRTEFDKVRPLNEFLDGGTGRLTAVTFVDPNVTGLPSEGHAADDHPPTDVQWGQAFLGEVIKRVMKSESWPTTMLIITYDEHGGFYDHVAPPGTARFHELNPDVDRDLPRVHPDEGKYGVRVPAFVVSPFVSQRAVGHRIYDHATIARTILQRFAPAQIGHMPERVRRSRHLGEVLQAEARTGIAPPPGAETPNPLRIRMDRSTPGVHLAAVRPDPEDAREDLTRLGIPRSP